MRNNRKFTFLILILIGLLLPAPALAAVKSRVVVRVGHPLPRLSLHHRVAPVRTVRIAPVNYGTIDFNVQPQQSRIYVDGAYLGIADQFNGYPQTAAFPAGYHDVRVESPSAEVVQRRVYVAAGKELNFNLKF